jgi:hypothetical protein
MRRQRPLDVKLWLRKSPKRILRANMSSGADQFGRIARRFDLAIVGQVEPDGSPIQAMISESTLFE